MSVQRANNDNVDQRVHVQGQPVESYPKVAPEAEHGAMRRITVVGEDVLHRPCREVTEFGTAELRQLIDDMFVTMYVADGVGLAANQVDVDLKLFVYDCTDEDGVRHVGHILNPRLDELAGEGRVLVEDGEGCLSVPGAGMELARPDHAVVHGLNSDGGPLTLEGFGYFARCLQHETDHLYGQLYVDRLSKRDRKKTLKEMEEQREQVFERRAAKAEAWVTGKPLQAGEPVD